MTVETVIAAKSTRPVDTLLREVAGGDRESFNILYAATSARIYGLVRKVLIDIGQSEEVTQEVFLEVWQLASRFDPARASATTWMLTIAHRRAVDRVRASESSRSRDLKIGARDFVTPSDAVAEHVEITLEHQRANRALQRLTPLQQEALTLAYWHGLTATEIAARLGVKKGTIATRLRDGLFRLRLEMEKT